MNRSRTALVVAAGIAAGVTVVAVAAVAAPHHRAATNASGDVDMQALAQLEGDPSASTAPSGAPAGPGHRGPGGMPGLGLLGGGILHGDVVVQGKDGKPVEVVVQRGTVTSVSDGTLVVHSSDGFDQTWTTGKDTRYVLGGFARGPWMHARPRGSGAPSAAPIPSAQPSPSSVAKGATVLVLGRANGSKPAATLVLSGPALMGGLGGDRFRPGNGHRWQMGPGGGPGMGPGHRFDKKPPAASPKPSGSASKA